MLLNAAFDGLMDFELVSTLARVFTDVAGAPIASLLFFGALAVSLYIVQRQSIIPLVLFTMIGGIALAEAPPVAGRLTIILFMLSVTGLGVLLYNRAKTAV